MALISNQHTQREKKILRYNTARNNRITIDGEDLEDVKTFTYLGSTIDEHDGSDEDVKARTGKARAAYLQLKGHLELKTAVNDSMVRIFSTNIKTVLLYGGGNLENYGSHHPEDTDPVSPSFTVRDVTTELYNNNNP
ncbi:unnamed protein product [Schistosoma mattheei]|uniref:Uncharacterized protein n=1 Tax=Schistosoma mattheei TaxID=31246 RepID=A0A183PM53_9TREM|nr:unnamed protein product [Schistosoma mattheei]